MQLGCTFRPFRCVGCLVGDVCGERVMCGAGGGGFAQRMGPESAYLHHYQYQSGMLSNQQRRMKSYCMSTPYKHVVKMNRLKNIIPLIALLLIMVRWKYDNPLTEAVLSSFQRSSLTPNTGFGSTFAPTSESVEDPLMAPSTEAAEDPLMAPSTESAEDPLMVPSTESAVGCSPQHHIMFLKTHKCASSTLQNIFLRYGYQHNLYFALGNSHYLGHPKKFMYNMMSNFLIPASGKLDIFTLHTRLNLPEHQKAMHPDAKWITIVRDPVEQFPSVYEYYELGKFYRKSLASFLNQSVEVLRKAPRWNNKHGRNTMLFDMGYPDTLPPDKLNEAIETLDSVFDYVMISDRMDESLILLREELCWTNQDIIGFTKNARVTGKTSLPRGLADKINLMNAEDTAIYNYFLNKHIQKVQHFGISKMSDEVKELQRLRKEYYDACVAEEVLGHDNRLKGNQEWKANVNAFLPKNNGNETCKLILMKEVSFVKMVRNHQLTLIKRSRRNKK